MLPTSISDQQGTVMSEWGGQGRHTDLSAVLILYIKESILLKDRRNRIISLETLSQIVRNCSENQG